MDLLYKAISSQIDSSVRRECLVFWNDPTGLFEPFISKLKEEIEDGGKKYKLIHFQGSFLESILELHSMMQDIKKPDCLVYVPYIRREEIKDTPFLEAYLSSTTLPDLPSDLLDLISGGYLSPEQLEKCKESIPSGYKAMEMAIGGEEIDPSIFSTPEVVNEFSIQLLCGETTFLDHLESHPEGTLSIIRNAFEKNFGYLPEIESLLFDEREREYSEKKQDHSIFRIPLGFYLLGREYVSDLENCNPNSEFLQKLQKMGNLYLDNIQNVLNKLRKNYPEAYRILAREIEETGNFEDEKLKRKSEELGVIDTFIFEDTIHQKETLRLLETLKYHKAESIVEVRRSSFWYREEKNIGEFWKWVELTTRLQKQISISIENFKSNKTLKEVIEDYSKNLYKIDRDYRDFCKITNSILKHSEYSLDIRKVRQKIWEEYSIWMIEVNNHYQNLCESKGFLPDEDLQQRFFYHKYIKPFMELGKTAVFFVDAMRYEVGDILKEQLEGLGFNTNIFPIYAELPTSTSVGMNVLVPSTKSGELEPLFDKEERKLVGFQTGNRQVRTIQDRQKVLEEVGNIKVEWIRLDELYKNYNEKKSSLISAGLTVVHSEEIDKAGETGFLAKGFDFFQDTISKIKFCIERLKEFQFENYLIVSDHGFIEYDIDSEFIRSDLKIPKNFKGYRRYVIDSEVNQNGYSKVKMEKLGYINTDKEITFLKEPKIFKDAPSNNGFFHEGNSLQERIIPVVSIQSEKKKLISFNNSKYKIQADLTLGKVNHVLDLEIVTLGDSILFQSAIKLYLNMELENSVTVNIKQANVVKYFQNEIEVKPNEKYRIEFEILNESDTINSPKDSLKVWNPSKDSGVQEWISKIKIPIPGVNLSIASSKNITLPSEIEGDVKVILEMLLESGSGLITEAGINRKFGDPRKAARANRLFSKFLSERSNELNFSIIVESGSEGRIYKVGRR